MEFIEPDRSNYIVSAHKPNDEGVRDIGFVKGTFLDGRSGTGWKCWCMDELIMASVFFDERYLTAWKRLILRCFWSWKAFCSLRTGLICRQAHEGR
mgnify:CR=1 FL=1